MDRAIEILDDVFGVLKRTKALSQIFDAAWYEEVKARVVAGGSIGMSPIYGLHNPLRGRDWYDKMHREVEAKAERGEELTYEEATVVCLMPDLARVWLEGLDNRLAAFRSIPFKTDVVDVKWRELISTRDTENFGPHAFEASVLGFFAANGVLRDIETDSENGRSTIDGLVQLDGRPMLVEATMMIKELIPKTEGVGWLDVPALLGVVKDKVMKKAGPGQQLGGITDKPALLVIGQNPWAADHLASKWAIDDLYKQGDAAVLSGVVVADSWVFEEAQLHPNGKAATLFTAREQKMLLNWFPERTRG